MIDFLTRLTFVKALNMAIHDGTYFSDWSKNSKNELVQVILENTPDYKLKFLDDSEMSDLAENCIEALHDKLNKKLIRK